MHAQISFPVWDSVCVEPCSDCMHVIVFFLNEFVLVFIGRNVVAGCSRSIIIITFGNR